MLSEAEAAALGNVGGKCHDNAARYVQHHTEAEVDQGWMVEAVWGDAGAMFGRHSIVRTSGRFIEAITYDRAYRFIPHHADFGEFDELPSQVIWSDKEYVSPTIEDYDDDPDDPDGILVDQPF